MALRGAVACALASVGLAVPQTLQYTSTVDVAPGFLSKMVQDGQLRSQMEAASADHFFAQTGVRASASVEPVSTRRQLQDQAGLTIMYSVTCGSNCVAIGNHLNALANNEACTCEGGLAFSAACVDDTGAECAVAPHSPGTPGQCACTATDSCGDTCQMDTIPGGLGVAHAQSLIQAVNQVAADAGFSADVVVSTPEFVAASITVPDTVYLATFDAPAYQNCEGQFLCSIGAECAGAPATCDQDTCTQQYVVTTQASIAYVNNFGFEQAAGEECPFDNLAQVPCSQGSCQEQPAPEPAPTEPTPEPAVCVNNQPEECGSADGVNTFCDIGGYADLGPCAQWNDYACDNVDVLESFYPGQAAAASAALIAACPLTCDAC